MNTNAANRLRAILHDALAKLNEIPFNYTAYLSWTKSENGNWRGTQEIRPSFPIELLENIPEELFAQCSELLRECIPAYGDIIGSESGVQMRVDERQVLGSLVGEIHKIKGDLTIDDGIIAAVVDNLLLYFSKTHISVEFTAPIVNLMMDEEIQEIPITDALKIKRLTNTEFTEIHGGHLSNLVNSLKPYGIRHPDVAFVGTFEDPIIRGMVLNEGKAIKEVSSILDRAILALRSYKGGAIGYLEIRLKALEYSFGYFGHSVKMHEVIPLDLYHLEKGDIPLFQEHIRSLIGKQKHSSLEIALFRLSDAENRPSARDKLIDAVIGLEAILLSTNAKQPYRQELRYRFSMNYSTFFETPKSKLDGFRKARSVYDLRSVIAHGGSFEDGQTYRFGSIKIEPHEVANEACGMLRKLIKWGLNLGDPPLYLKEGFWENRIFGLLDE